MKDFYHALCRILGGHQVWINLNLDNLLQNVVVPFVGKHISVVKYDATKAVINMSTITYLRIFRTPKRLPSNKNPIELLSSTEMADAECTEEVLKHAKVDYAWPESRSVLESALSPLKKQIFVIMKFNDKVLDAIYHDIIKPIIKNVGYQPKRIDEVENSGNITEQLLQEIAQSEIILCELTGERPNCYYETGFAHALGRQLILAIRKGDKIHFDLASHRFIEWKTRDELRSLLKKRLDSIIKHNVGFIKDKV